jgi:hypothetical protein
MGTHSGDTGPADAPGATGRRDFLRRATIVSTGALAVPMIVTVDSADAQALTSPPPEAPGSSDRPQKPAVEPVNEPATGSGALRSRGGGSRASRRGVSGRTELPRTGADIDRMVAAGLAATAGGAALLLWSADAQSRPAPESPAPGAADPETTT